MKPRILLVEDDRAMSDNLAAMLSEQLDEPMDKYECTVCEYVYDPDEGNPENGIEPGTSFENLPDDWVCPVCGASKDQFEKVE